MLTKYLFGNMNMNINMNSGLIWPPPTVAALINLEINSLN